MWCDVAYFGLDGFGSVWLKIVAVVRRNLKVTDVAFHALEVSDAMSHAWLGTGPMLHTLVVMDAMTRH